MPLQRRASEQSLDQRRGKLQTIWVFIIVVFIVTISLFGANLLSQILR
jgi:hypothetical protein